VTETSLTKFQLPMKFLLLDDHPFALKSLEDAVRSIVPNAEIYSYSTVEDASNALAQSTFNFVICDMQIQSGKSLDVPLYCYRERVPFMVFSSHSNKQLISDLNQLRITCMINKSSPTEELHEGIRNLLNCKKYYCSINQSFIDDTSEFIETPRLSLTPVQRKILSLLGQGYDVDKIAELMHIVPRTVINHLAIIRNNNLCSSTPELLRRYRFWE